MFYFNLFKQDDATGNQPLYKNNKIVVEEDILLKAGQVYSGALWKKTETNDGKPVNMVSLKIEENNFVYLDNTVSFCQNPDYDLDRLYRKKSSKIQYKNTFKLIHIGF